MVNQQVSMALPKDLLDFVASGNKVAVLATFSEKGLPHTMPIIWLCPKGNDSVLIAIQSDTKGYINMVWQKKVMMNFIGEGNIAYSFLGRAGVVKAPSSVHPLMNIVRVDFIRGYRDNISVVDFVSAACWSYSSAEARDFGLALMRELKELAKSL